MSLTEGTPVQFVDGLAQARERIKEIARDLRMQHPDQVVRHGIDFLVQESKHVVEIFLELSSGPGRYLCWWIEISYAETQWRIESSLQKNDGGGEEVVSESADEVATLELVFSALANSLDGIEKFSSRQDSRT